MAHAPELIYKIHHGLGWHIVDMLPPIHRWLFPAFQRLRDTVLRPAESSMSIQSQSRLQPMVRKLA